MPVTRTRPRVLRDAGLVRVRRDAQRRMYALESQGLAEMDARLSCYRHFWSERLTALERAHRRKGRIMTATLGTLVGGDAVRFERLLPGPIDRVWACLTDSERLPLWFSADSVAPAVGATCTSTWAWAVG